MVMHTVSRVTLRTTLADVIGVPETWPDYTAKRDGARANMRGACISEFAASDGSLAISTEGGVDGPTLSVFFVEDPDLLERATKVLQVGMNVNAAVLLAI
jgi:hypothetical protein